MRANAGMHEALEDVADGAVLSNDTIGAGLPSAAARHLRLAAVTYPQCEVAEAHLHSARAIAPNHAAVLIGLYRFYFYKNRLREALDVARLCLLKAAADNGLDANWREVESADADFSNFAALPRFFLFTLKAYAYLCMRLGDIEEGHAALVKLLDLDPTDKVGAKVLIGVLDRMGTDDEG